MPGDLGADIDLQIQLALWKSDLWPIVENAPKYSEDDIFDMLEFLYDHISLPTKGGYHQFSNCGWHYHKFDRPPGQAEFRAAVNTFLPAYADGYELSAQGEILSKGPDGLSLLFGATIPHPDDDNIVARVRAAERKFRLRGSTPDDRRDAVRDLADVLEYLRPQVKQVLTKKDEGDILELANRFGIRHHDEDQATDYDKDIWYSWAFYCYLATIHASLRLIERRQGKL